MPFDQRPGYRAIQYDLARGRIPTPATILLHARLLQPFGLTTVFLYLEGVVENEVFPATGCGSTPVTAAYIADLERGLGALGIGLVPIFQVLGHMEHLLALPAYAHHGEQAPSGNSCFRLDREETTEAICRWLTAVTHLFSNPLVHVGCDEASSVGMGASQEHVTRLGLAPALARHLNRVCAHLKSLGRQPMLYADLLIHFPALSEALDPDAILMNWNYGTEDECYEFDNHHFARHRAATARHRHWVSGNGMAEYVLPPFGRLAGNLTTWRHLAAESGAEGVLISDWGSQENAHPLTLTFLGALLGLMAVADGALQPVRVYEEMARLLLGRQDRDLIEGLAFLFEAQGDRRFAADRRVNMYLGPYLQVLAFKDPRSLHMLRLCGTLTRDELERFEHASRSACARLDAVAAPSAEWQARMLEDLRMLAHRALATALRAQLCYDAAWDTGSIWLSEAELEPRRRRLAEYQHLARRDRAWHGARWDEECLPSCKDRSLAFLERSAAALDGIVRFHDNALHRYRT